MSVVWLVFVFPWTFRCCRDPVDCRWMNKWMNKCTKLSYISISFCWFLSMGSRNTFQTQLGSSLACWCDVWCELEHQLSPVTTCLPSIAYLVLPFFWFWFCFGFLFFVFSEPPSGNVPSLNFLIWPTTLRWLLLIINLLMKTARSDTHCLGRGLGRRRSLFQVPNLSLSECASWV